MTTGDVLLADCVSPWYAAVSESVPTGKLRFVKVATPPTRVALPTRTPPFVNVTLPVGCISPVEVTVAVNVTACPCTDGFGFEVRVVVVLNTVVPRNTVTAPEPPLVDSPDARMSSLWSPFRSARATAWPRNTPEA